MTVKFECLDIVTDEQAVEQFVERVAAFRLVDWLSVAAAVTSTASSRAEATAALDRVIAQHGLAFDAWSVGDDVETAFHWSVGATGFTPSPRDCLSLRIAREAATKAAVALFVGPLLTAADFECLYRPFDALVPRPSGRSSPRPAAARPPVELAPRSPAGGVAAYRDRKRGLAVVSISTPVPGYLMRRSAELEYARRAAEPHSGHRDLRHAPSTHEGDTHGPAGTEPP